MSISADCFFIFILSDLGVISVGMTDGWHDSDGMTDGMTDMTVKSGIPQAFRPHIDMTLAPYKIVCFDSLVLTSV